MEKVVALPRIITGFSELGINSGWRIGEKSRF